MDTQPCEQASEKSPSHWQPPTFKARQTATALLSWTHLWIVNSLSSRVIMLPRLTSESQPIPELHLSQNLDKISRGNVSNNYSVFLTQKVMSFLFQILKDGFFPWHCALVCLTKKTAITEDTDPVIEGIHTFETIRNYLINKCWMYYEDKILHTWRHCFEKHVLSSLAASNKSFLLWKIKNKITLRVRRLNKVKFDKIDNAG